MAQALPAGSDSLGVAMGPAGPAGSAAAGGAGAAKEELLTDLDGAPLDSERLTAILAAELDGAKVLAVEIVPGTERRWPQSHSGKLRLVLQRPARGNAVALPQQQETRLLFFKKAVAQHHPGKTPAALRRTLATNRSEARFYRGFVPKLAARGVPFLRAFWVDERFEALAPPGSEVTEVAAPPSSGRADEQEAHASLRSTGMLLLLESAEGYSQASPLDAEQAGCTLRLLARMHAAAWEDRELLARAADQLHPTGGTWVQREAAELQRARSVWPRFLQAFTPIAPGLLGRPELVRLAERLEAVVPQVVAETTASPGSSFATLLHGDFKAANAFLPEDARCGGMAVPIDFQGVGVGFGMGDVAMHLIHSVSFEALCDGGEERLVSAYLEALAAELSPAAAAAYTPEVAWRQYRLAVLSYSRMLLGGFVTDASPEAYAAQNASPRAINVGMIFRDRRAALRLVERVDSCLRYLEREAAADAGADGSNPAVKRQRLEPTSAKY
mmetsp:Transcript_4178/g.12612  ORF Transcript_4178/g.12612 Transcript_4178/m.12612 type:complete len:500 (+) Transcript_4178:3-1502(+)